jgi:hypothetical protein
MTQIIHLTGRDNSLPKIRSKSKSQFQPTTPTGIGQDCLKNASAPAEKAGPALFLSSSSTHTPFLPSFLPPSTQIHQTTKDIRKHASYPPPRRHSGSHLHGTAHRPQSNRNLSRNLTQLYLQGHAPLLPALQASQQALPASQAPVRSQLHDR